VDDYLSEIQIYVKKLTSKQTGTSKEDTGRTQAAEGETICHIQRLHRNFCPCHGSGGYSPASHYGGPGTIPV